MAKLSQQDICQILILLKEGDLAKSEIAKIYRVDNATIHFHKKKYSTILRLPREDIEDYFYRKKQNFCLHPSFKCTLCGLHIDNLKSDQTLKIKEFKKRIDYLETLCKNNKVQFEPRSSIIK